METEQKEIKHKKTLEQREIETKQKLENIQAQKMNRFIRVIWSSGISHRKSELNKDKTKTPVEKVLILREYLTMSLKSAGYKEIETEN